jgi:hypothetical protein
MDILWKTFALSSERSHQRSLIGKKSRKSTAVLAVDSQAAHRDGRIAVAASAHATGRTADLA